MTHNAVTVAGYDYLGMSQVTGVHHPEPGVFRRHDSGSLGVYPDLDQFGRLTASRWTRDLTTDIDFVSGALTCEQSICVPEQASQFVHRRTDSAERRRSRPLC